MAVERYFDPETNTWISIGGGGAGIPSKTNLEFSSAELSVSAPNDIVFFEIEGTGTLSLVTTHLIGKTTSSALEAMIAVYVDGERIILDRTNDIFKDSTKNEIRHFVGASPFYQLSSGTGTNKKFAFMTPNDGADRLNLKEIDAGDFSVGEFSSSSSSRSGSILLPHPISFKNELKIALRKPLGVPNPTASVGILYSIE